jgi:hypothetical protein
MPMFTNDGQCSKRRNSLKAAVPYYTQEYDEIVKHTPANEKVGKYIFKISSTKKKHYFL